MLHRRINFFTDQKYHIFRSIFFWFFSGLFVVCTPIVIYLALGYKFDPQQQIVIKTSTIAVTTFPENAVIKINDEKTLHQSPCVLRELSPGIYRIAIEKNGFYSYLAQVTLKPSVVAGVDVVLVPKIESFDNAGLNLNIYKFFMSKKFFGEKIVAIAGDGIYFLDQYFKNPQRICVLKLSQNDGCAVDGLIEADKNIIFWNKNKIWVISVIDAQNCKNPQVYASSEGIKDVFLGLKDRYLIIHDGLKLVVMDMSAPSTFYQPLKFKSADATVFYDSNSETLYVNDFVPEMKCFSLFKTQLIKLVLFNHEDKRN